MYSGPSDSTFHHPDFLLSDGPKFQKVQRDNHLPVHVLNGLEQFAAVVLAAKRQHLMGAEFTTLFRPTVGPFIQTVNQYYDLICWQRAQDPNLYSSIQELYMEWERLMVELMQDHYSHMDKSHNLSVICQAMRTGRDVDFQDYKSNSAPDHELSRHIRLEAKPEQQFVWIQAVNSAGQGIPGCPIEITLHGAYIAKIVTGTHAEDSRTTKLWRITFLQNWLTKYFYDFKKNPQNPTHIVVHGNSTGTVSLNVELSDIPNDHGFASVDAQIPQ
jgi:hypothetical protein